MKRGPSRSFVRPDTGSSLLRRVEDPSDSVEDGTPPRPPTAPPPTAPPPVPAPAPPPTSENSDQLDREEIFTRISTSTISLKPVVPNRRSFSNARVGSYVPVKPKNSSNDKEGDKSDNVSGKISVAYSMVSVDSVDSVDTVNSVRIDESKAEPTVYANNRDQESNDQKPSVLPKTSPLVQKSSSDTKDLIKVKEARNGEATLSNSSSSSTTSSIPVTNSLPALKKKPELKAKPKIAKVIPVVKSVSTTVIKPNGPVGFSSLPKQLHRRALRRGFEFSLMVVGESGLGKSTLINSMFLTNVYSSSLGKTSKPEQTLEVESHSILLEEAGVKLSLTVLDTPGFGDKLDNANCWYPISCYIEEQFDKFLEAETRVNRVRLADTRVHACLYFIAPSGHRLKELDIEFMRKLCGKVNIIPVIGKSDSLTKEELGDFKQRVSGG